MPRKIRRRCPDRAPRKESEAQSQRDRRQAIEEARAAAAAVQETRRNPQKAVGAALTDHGQGKGEAPNGTTDRMGTPSSNGKWGG